ncbi:MAG: vWA domain-containing protein [Verrucomicrobiota bacterium]
MQSSFFTTNHKSILKSFLVAAVFTASASNAVFAHNVSEKKDSPTNSTHISILLDRSGSMDSIREDTIGGFNQFLDDQRDNSTDATLSFVQFDSSDSYEVIYDFQDLAGVSDLDRNDFVPRGGTPLLDAIGRSINDLEADLDALSEDERPEKVVMAIITDGRENSSFEFTKTEIESMIDEKQDEDDWQFVFLSSDLSAIGEAQILGFQPFGVLKYENTSEGVSSGWSNLSNSFSEYSSNSEQSVMRFDRPHVHAE